jgi:23S rRNA (uracil1939-C5)-methyltransferase
VVTLEITGLSHDGLGVGRLDDEVIFVPDALPGESVRVRLGPQAGRSRQARVLERTRSSPERIRPVCILADHCGGCSTQHLDDGAEARWKGERVEQVLRRIGGIEHPVEPLIAADATLGYRNRATIPLGRDSRGRLRAGFYRRGSHRIVNMNHCPVLDPRLDALIAPIKADLDHGGWPLDADLQIGGGLRHLGLRLGAHTGEILITLISSDPGLEGLQELAADWRQRWPPVAGVVLNLQPEPTNRLFGTDNTILAGRDWLLERFGGIELRIAADTFFQVHTQQAERVLPLLQAALARAGVRSLVDAYCGIGTFSLPLAAAGFEVLGLEQHRGALQQAIANADRNGLARLCRFRGGDVAALLQEALPGRQALLLDPPRRGLDAAVVACIRATPPPLLLYLSCDPATLARDLARLLADGRNEGANTDGQGGSYALVSVQPIDFFPQTSHVETLVVLERRR